MSKLAQDLVKRARLEEKAVQIYEQLIEKVLMGQRKDRTITCAFPSCLLIAVKFRDKPSMADFRLRAA